VSENRDSTRLLAPLGELFRHVAHNLVECGGIIAAAAISHIPRSLVSSLPPTPRDALASNRTRERRASLAGGRFKLSISNCRRWSSSLVPFSFTSLKFISAPLARRGAAEGRRENCIAVKIERARTRVDTLGVRKGEQQGVLTSFMPMKFAA